MQNLELIKRAAFQRGFQKEAVWGMVNPALKAGAGLGIGIRAASKMGKPTWVDAVAQSARSARPAVPTVGRPIAPYQGFSFAHNKPSIYRNFDFSHNGARIAAPWWKMGLGQGGGVRKVFGQGMSSPYIKYPALAALAGGAGYGIDHMASGGMTPDGYKANWGMFSGGPPEMMPPMMPPEIQHQMYA